MVPDWVNSDLCAVCCLGVGGVLLGLLGLTSRERRGVALVALLVVAAMVWLALRGQPAGFWAPPAGLAVFILLGRVSRSRHFTGSLVMLGSWARSRTVQALILLLIGPALALAWIHRLEEQLAPNPDWADTTELSSIESIHTVVCEAFTDKGRPVSLCTKTFTADEEATLRRREELFAQTRALRLIRVSEAVQVSNCHGWTFAGGAYWIASDAVDSILEDNGYYPVSSPEPNDVVIYRKDNGLVNHSGLVRAAPSDGPVLVESKWGGLGRYIHQPQDTPYGGSYTYYRTARPNHLLNGVSRPAIAD